MRRRRWPLVVIGGSAGTATWSGWVGLGSLTGFGIVHPLPGIWDGLTLNTAITLPIGVEAYAVYALAVATQARPLPLRSRRYAWASAATALVIGMAGQIAYHLLAAAGVTRAPWWVVTAVSCLPVAVLGAASLLWHLAGQPSTTLDLTDTGVRPAGLAEPEVRAFLDAPPGVFERRPAAGSQRSAPPKRRRATDADLAAIVEQARAERPGAGEPAIRRLLAEAELAASGARVRAAMTSTRRESRSGT